MDRDKTTRVDRPAGQPEDFPGGPEEKERKPRTGRRMTPSFSRPGVSDEAIQNRQAKRPSFLNDRTPRSMFYLPMLNPLSLSFPHKLLSQEQSGGEHSSYPCEN
ncbi:unnamed protein product [Dovyalis caffra]|uniref:Uncharacterized protein n=1 Tax=Dovyalis caffra TaxID=77055 RepID=A0AAV1QNJ4_9ROSI|nr:unnamed protein product [Dovyalis caffra]